MAATRHANNLLREYARRRGYLMPMNNIAVTIDSTNSEQLNEATQIDTNASESMTTATNSTIISASITSDPAIVPVGIYSYSVKSKTAQVPISGAISSCNCFVAAGFANGNLCMFRISANGHASPAQPQESNMRLVMPLADDISDDYLQTSYDSSRRSAAGQLLHGHFGAVYDAKFIEDGGDTRYATIF